MLLSLYLLSIFELVYLVSYHLAFNCSSFFYLADCFCILIHVMTAVALSFLVEINEELYLCI